LDKPKITNVKIRNLTLTMVLIALLVLISFLIKPLGLLNSFQQRVLNLCAIYAIIAISYNLVNGFTGMFSLGQAGFMAIGAYSVGIFTLPLAQRAQVFYMQPMNPLISWIHMPLIAAMIVGGLLAAAAAFLVGFPVLRLKGDYLAIATLGFSEIIRIVLTNAQSFTNGALGIKSIPPIDSMGIMFSVLIITVVVLGLFISSSYGRALKAIREDEIAAESMGIGLLRHKLLAFMISAFFAGIGGGLYGALLGTVDPRNFMFTLTYNFLLMIVLGGLGSLSGSVIGAFIVTAGMEILRFFDNPLTVMGVNIPIFRPGLRMVVFSLLLLVVVLFWHHGIMGTREITWDSLLRFRKTARNLPKGKKPRAEGSQ